MLSAVDGKLHKCAQQVGIIAITSWITLAAICFGRSILRQQSSVYIRIKRGIMSVHRSFGALKKMAKRQVQTRNKP